MTINNNWKGFLFRIVVPSIITILLFIVSFYVYFLPAFEKNMIDNKREMISELTSSVWSVLNNYHEKEKSNILTIEQAQKQALQEIQTIRYGKEGKDYFWINNMHPKMLMHPYRTDLNGTDLSDFKDLKGKRIFVDFVEIVNQQSSGYLDYTWQWKDDSTKLVQKLSYVKGFKPWGWIIGTGVYINDVEAEIASIEHDLIIISVIIIVFILLMLVIIITNSIKIEQRKTIAENKLIESKEKYRILVEQTKEGSIMILENKIIYSNNAVSNILGYSSKELSSIDVNSIFNSKLLFNEFLLDTKTKQDFETNLITKNGDIVSVNLCISKIIFGDKNAVTLIIRDISKDNIVKNELDIKKEQFKSLTKNIDIGVFRTTFNNKSKFTEVNPATLNILGFTNENELLKHNIFDLFQNKTDKKSFLQELISAKKVNNKTVRIKTKNGNIIASVSLTVIKDCKGNQFCDGVIRDITEKTNNEKQKEQVFNELQASQFILNCSIKQFTRNVVKCSINTSILELANIMNNNNADAVIINSDNNNIGIVTDFDIRTRVVAKAIDLQKSVSEIMTAPIISINENSFVFEAIMLINENKISHLFTTNSNNEITQVISAEQLQQLSVQSSSFILKEINSANYLSEIINAKQNLHWIVNSMISSGVNTKIVTGLLASVFNNIVEKLIELAIVEFGNPPVKFAYVGLGSEGRGEETLITDQDNAIIFEDVSTDKYEEVKTYFDKFGAQISDWLNELGYDYCKGNIMAKNTKWCQPLSIWQNYFTKWISTAQAQDLLEVNIFFDYKCLYGDSSLTNKLRTHIGELVKLHPQFFIYMVQNTLLYKPPLNVFGNIVLESNSDNVDTFSVKEALIPIVSFARIYSIQHSISQTNTLERLEILFNTNILSLSTYNEIKYSYNYLMQLRLKHQISQIEKGNKANNYISPKKLTNIDCSTIKKVFTQVQNFQTKLSYDFKGAR